MEKHPSSVKNSEEKHQGLEHQGLEHQGLHHQGQCSVSDYSQYLYLSYVIFHRETSLCSKGTEGTSVNLAPHQTQVYIKTLSPFCYVCAVKTCFVLQKNVCNVIVFEILMVFYLLCGRGHTSRPPLRRTVQPVHTAGRKQSFISHKLQQHKHFLQQTGQTTDIVFNNKCILTSQTTKAPHPRPWMSDPGGASVLWELGCRE